MLTKSWSVQQILTIRSYAEFKSQLSGSDKVTFIATKTRGAIQRTIELESLQRAMTAVLIFVATMIET